MPSDGATLEVNRKKNKKWKKQKKIHKPREKVRKMFLFGKLEL